MPMSSSATSVPLSSDVQKDQAEISRSHTQLYRPDIDGLRAVAALAVVGVHAYWLSGGGFGVDIFFVISGFLISGIILRALQEGRFSLFDFYLRRVRRIFPALIVVLTGVAIFGWIFLPSAEYRSIGLQVAAGAGFAENLWLYVIHRQLSGPADYMLGHLWTLGVEEQFYLVWPLLLMTMWLLPRQWRWRLIAVFTALSFGSYIWANSWQRVLPWNRFWELAQGAMLAYLQHVESTGARSAWLARFLRPPISHSLGTIGWICIIVALLGPDLFDKSPVGKGWLPTLGAFMAIAAGPEQWINRRVLTARPMVFIGLISYPLYLWHMPLFLLANILHGDASFQRLPVAWAVTVIVTSLFLAYVTFRYIELPLRSSASIRGVAFFLCIAMAICGTAAYFVLH